MVELVSPRAQRTDEVHLLVVEDNPLDARALARSAGRIETPVDVTVAENGALAVEHLRSSLPIDLVLLDLNLPLLSGHEVLAIMNDDDTLRTVPTVVLTTSSVERDVMRAYELGANAFLNKPSELAGWDDLLRGIEAFWLSWVTFPRRVA